MNILDIAFLQLRKEFNFNHMKILDWNKVWNRYLDLISIALKKFHNIKN